MATYQTDWLATETVFYHERTAQVSQNILQIIDYKDFDWDWPGLQNYLAFGYSVFGRTPVRGVRFVPPASQLTVANGQLVVANLQPDPFLLDQLASPSTPAQVLEMLSQVLAQWRASLPQPSVVLPLSGGFDSRLLLALWPQPTELAAFTYGVADPQANSVEVVHARHLAQHYGLRWQQIELATLGHHLPEWYDLFGPSAHAHGMYHLEFYHRIAALGWGQKPLLSGALGDAWAGKMEVPPIRAPDQVGQLAFAHGKNADGAQLQQTMPPNPILEAFYEEKKTFLADPRFRIIEAMRAKMMLLKYLWQVPRALGYQPFAPLVQPELALAMLRLPTPQRANRHWQTAFFARHGLGLERLPLLRDYHNYQQHQAALAQPLAPLSEVLLREIIKPEYVRWVNRNLLNTWHSRLGYRLFRRFRTTRGLWRLFPDRADRAIAAYLTLAPLERLIRARDAHTRGHQG
jgi:Asparagine synthase